MSEVKNSGQMVQDVKKPYTYEGNVTDLKNVLTHLTNNTTIQHQILKILEEGTSNYSKLEKTLSAVRNDLRDILKSTQNNNTNFRRDSDLVKHVKTRLSDMQSQLKEVSSGISTMTQPKQKNKNREEKKKNKELKREENNKKNPKKTDNKVKKSSK